MPTNNSAAAVDAQLVISDAMFRARNRGNAAGVNLSLVSPTAFLTGPEQVAIIAANKIILAAQESGQTIIASTSSKSAGQGVIEPVDYKWNLPPHSWSLPVRPSTLEPDVSKAAFSSTFHNLRRGRLWFWGGADEINTYAEDGTVTTLGAKAGASSDPNKATDASAKLVQAETNYGFQFLWNPSSISSSVSRNMDITPNSSDRLKSVVGAFPGQETVSFNIVIDRINDFACLKAADNPGALAQYYGTSYPGSESETASSKISNLMKQGTMADLEYLFKAINGGSESWVTLLGKKTANIGFLMPTLLGLVLGPDLQNNLSYVGWLTGLTMQHEMFTENMIPLRTTVSINMECFAGSGLVSS
jgi:hypothetical protein